MRLLRAMALACILLAAAAAGATVFGSVRGIVHDPQHRPIAGAEVELRSATSDWHMNATANDAGEFLLRNVPLGSYTITASAPGFATASTPLIVTAGNTEIVHLPLSIATVQQSVNVSAEPDLVNPTSTSAQTELDQRQIAATPGAQQANSLAFITDYVPSAVLVHDQLHIRGGHQVMWMIDGIPVPNTNIASNVGPQFDPKDIDAVEISRGGLTADTGDRTYGSLNVVTRSGFEFNREGELLLSFGSHFMTDDQLSFGSHSERFAWYASLSGNRSDLGLETPVPEIIHDQAAGLGAFTSLIFNATPSDQLRLVASVRGDDYQVPNTPADQASGIRNTEDERDSFANVSWVHTYRDGLTVTLAPFFHFNRAHFQGTQPLSGDDRGSTYAGGIFEVGIVQGHHNAHIGWEGMAQHDNEFLQLLGAPPTRSIQWGGLEAIFVEDQYRATGWLTFNGGVRLTHFSGGIEETAADPRVGAALQIPRLHWVLRAFYGRYYQPPPLQSVTGSFAGADFLPLSGERDEQHEFGLAIPFRGWAFDIANFRTGTRNFFDHDAIDNSNVFFPLTIASARIRGWEATARSPHVGGRFDFHLAYSHQYAEGKGGVTGGLTGFIPPLGYYFLDHDQRDTLSVGMRADLPRRVWTSSEIGYGSGFLDGDGPAHLPPHATWDFSLGKTFGERFSASFTALNLTNARYLLDNSNTFGGTHWATPRTLFGQVRFRFKY